MAATNCSASSSAAPAGGVHSLTTALNALSTASAGVSVEPKDYVWGQPSPAAQQQLYQQFSQLALLMGGFGTASMACHPAYQCAQRAAMFSAFMPPFAGYAPPMPVPCPSSSPSPPPCAPAPATLPQSKASSGSRQDPVQGKASAKPPRRPAAGATSKAKSSKACSRSAASNGSCPVPPAVSPDAIPDLNDDFLDEAFLEHLHDDVSEGSNGSSVCSDVKEALQKKGSDGSLCNNGEPGLWSAFDQDMDDLPAAAAQSAGNVWATAPVKAGSADLNNLLPAASTPRSARSARAAPKDKDTGTTSKVTLKVKGGGVQKAASTKTGKAQQQAAVGAAVASAAAAPGAGAAQAPTAEDCALTAADLSRLLGEDDNSRIPDGWDLDLDFDNPFSCSITAF